MKPTVGVKEYSIYVCPPTGNEGNHPVYTCDDNSVSLQPNTPCPTCGKIMQPASVADTEYYLSIYEMWA